MMSHRRRALLVHSAGQIGIGISYFVFPTKSRARGLAWMPEVVTPQLFGLIPFIIGIIVFTIAVRNCSPSAISHAFVLAGIPWAAYVGVFLMAQILGTHPQGIASAISYAILTGTLIIAALTPDPPPDTVGKLIDDMRRRDE